MGRRSEQRIVILIPVIVRGTDACGNPFELKAETCDISVNGARFRGLADVAARGNKIEVECKGRKAWYRIDWVGKTRTISANQLGIRLLEPGKYIWGIPPKDWAPDTFNSSLLASYDRGSLPGIPQKTPPAAPVSEDRRRFPRKLYRVETQVTSEDSFVKQPGKITDISLGGCYVEMIGPPPIDTRVELDLNSGENATHLSGIVRSSQMGFGMGIEFTEMSASDFETLRSIAPPVSTLSDSVPSVPGRSPSRSPIPQPKPIESRQNHHSSSMEESTYNLTATSEAFEAIVRLLFRKGLLTRAELVEEIESLKNAKVGSLL